MFFFLSKILDVFLSPFTWGVLLLAIAIPFRRPSRRRRRAWRRRRVVGVVGLAILVLFATEPVSDALFYPLEHESRSTYRPDVTYDVVILLGGVTSERLGYETGEPAYNDNIERLTATHRILKENHARYAILSGAAMDPTLREWGEARVLERQLVLWGIDGERLIPEEEARNTRENAVYSQRIVAARGFRKVLVVTSAFHMPRAIECFAAVGMTFDTLSVDFRTGTSGAESILPRTGFLNLSAVAFREYAGRLMYRLSGYAKPAAKPIE